MESLFRMLKVERVHARIYTTQTETHRDLFADIEGVCNSRHLH